MPVFGQVLGIGNRQIIVPVIIQVPDDFDRRSELRSSGRIMIVIAGQDQIGLVIEARAAQKNIGDPESAVIYLKIGIPDCDVIVTVTIQITFVILETEIETIDGKWKLQTAQLFDRNGLAESGAGQHGADNTDENRCSHGIQPQRKEPFRIVFYFSEIKLSSPLRYLLKPD
jgi:hypothetical protein